MNENVYEIEEVDRKGNWKKNITLFLFGQSISLFGSSLVQFAIIWYITLETKSGLMMTIATLCGVLPQVLISLFAGVWADKYNKKKMIIIPDIVIAVTTLILGILFLCGINHIWLLFLVMAIRSLGTGIQTPAVNSFIPNLVPTDKLMKVNGINGTVQSIILILSPIASGGLLGSISLGNILFVDCITAVIGVTIMLFIKYIYIPSKTTEKINYYHSIQEGFIYIKKHTLINRIVKYSFILSFLITPMAILTPLLVTRSFGSEAILLTLNEISFFVGSIIGGILIATWGGFKNRLHTVGLAAILCGLFSVIMGLSTNFVLFLVMMALIGVMVPLFNTPFLVILQEKIDVHLQGRIFSLIQIITGGIMPVSMLLYGPLSDTVKIEHILMVVGILFILVSICLTRDTVILKGLAVEEAPLEPAEEYV